MKFILALIVALPVLAGAQTQSCTDAAGNLFTFTPSVVIPPPSCTAPQPPPDTQTVACPTGATGTWTQTRTYSAAAYPTCWTPGAWTPATAPAGACTPVVTPPPSGFTANAGFGLVSGTFTQGKQVTITGPNFGAHANYNSGKYTWQGNAYLNALSQDFSTGVFTQGLSQDDIGATWTVQKSGCPANSAQCVLWKHATSNQGVVEFSPKTNPNQIYADFKILPSSTIDAKIFRIWPVGDSVFWATGGGSMNLRAGNNSGANDAGGSGQFSTSAFNHVELLTAANSTIANLNAQQQWTRPWPAVSAINIIGHTIDLGNYIPAGSAVFSDYFLDYTFVRCELADAPTWAAAKHHEFQVPVAWSATQITLAVNGGEIGTAGRYLYCFDAANNPTQVGQVAAK